VACALARGQNTAALQHKTRAMNKKKIVVHLLESVNVMVCPDMQLTVP
jgi:hypothetical protein